MTEELIEQVARAIEDQLTTEDGWEVGTPALRTMCLDFAKAAIAAMQPHIEARCEDAARRALEAAAADVKEWFPVHTMEEPRYAAGRAMVASIRAIDPAQFRRPADG